MLFQSDETSASDDEVVFKIPDEPRPKTPTGKHPSIQQSVSVKRAKTSVSNPAKMMMALKKNTEPEFLGGMIPLYEQRSSPDAFWWDGVLLVPTTYENSMHLFVEDMCFPPAYTPTKRQGKLIDWAKFAIQYNPYLLLNALDCKTVDVVLEGQTIYVVPYSGLTLATMESRFFKVISLLGKSHHPSNHYKGKTLTQVMHPSKRINSGYSKDPYTLSKEYALAIIDSHIKKEIIMIEKPEDDQKTTAGYQQIYYSVAQS